MSRIGKNPVTVPSGVTATVNGREISVKGSKGELSWSVPQTVDFKLEDNVITFSPSSGSKESRAQWGLSRAITANMVEGVSNGFEKKLELKGVGYRANMQGTKLVMTLGHSHPVEMEVPAGLQVSVTGNTSVTVTGACKQAVGQFAAEIRFKRPVEPFKGKGVRYVGEQVYMKEGKKK